MPKQHRTDMTMSWIYHGHGYVLGIVVRYPSRYPDVLHIVRPGCAKLHRQVAAPDTWLCANHRGAATMFGSKGWGKMWKQSVHPSWTNLLATRDSCHWLSSVHGGCCFFAMGPKPICGTHGTIAGHSPAENTPTFGILRPHLSEHLSLPWWQQSCFAPASGRKGWGIYPAISWGFCGSSTTNAKMFFKRPCHWWFLGVMRLKIGWHFQKSDRSPACGSWGWRTAFT